MQVLTTAADARARMADELTRGLYPNKGGDVAPEEKTYYLLRSLGLPSEIAERLAEPLERNGPMAFMGEIQQHVPASSSRGNPPRFKPWISAHDADAAGVLLLAATAGVAHPEAQIVREDGIAARASALDPEGRPYDDMTMPSPREIFDWVLGLGPAVLDPDRELARLGDAIEGMIGPQ